MTGLWCAKREASNFRLVLWKISVNARKPNCSRRFLNLSQRLKPKMNLSASFVAVQQSCIWRDGYVRIGMQHENSKSISTSSMQTLVENPLIIAFFFDSSYFSSIRKIGTLMRMRLISSYANVFWTHICNTWAVKILHIHRNSKSWLLYFEYTLYWFQEIIYRYCQWWHNNLVTHPVI